MGYIKKIIRDFEIREQMYYHLMFLLIPSVFLHQTIKIFFFIILFIFNFFLIRQYVTELLLTYHLMPSQYDWLLFSTSSTFQERSSSSVHLHMLFSFSRITFIVFRSLQIKRRPDIFQVTYYFILIAISNVFHVDEKNWCATG